MNCELQIEFDELERKFNELEVDYNQLKIHVENLQKIHVENLQKTERTLTCVYCGQEYPPGTPTSGVSVLTEHIRQCSKHPMSKIRLLLIEAVRLLKQRAWSESAEYALKNEIYSFLFRYEEVTKDV